MSKEPDSKNVVVSTPTDAPPVPEVIIKAREYDYEKVNAQLERALLRLDTLEESLKTPICETNAGSTLDQLFREADAFLSIGEDNGK